uniref:Nucleic-acid-binding protein from transposon X-element n=1 Tax=Ceratitis capitata TaxID=7213 RepID=W8AFQ2_CERCA
MPPGPPLVGGNRFALLADKSKIKKKKNKNSLNKKLDLFPELPAVQTNKNPKFVVLEAVDKKKTLSQYSCFAVHRSINVISKEIQSISELRDGNLLLLVNNENVAEKFIASKELHGICAIKAKYHDHLNFNKGTVYAPFLSYVPEDEIIKELSSQGVVAVYKFQKNGVVLLTFDLFHIPEKLNIAWRKVSVRQYFPSPMRCKNCQLLGHTAKFCKRSPACEICSLPPHSPDVCTRIFCANCSSSHPSSSNICEKFLQAKEILKIKITKKCTMREAINFHKNSTPSFTESSPSFYSIAKPNTSQQPEHNQSTYPLTSSTRYSPKDSNHQQNLQSSEIHNRTGSTQISNISINNNSQFIDNNDSLRNYNFSLNSNPQDNNNIHKQYSPDSIDLDKNIQSTDNYNSPRNINSPTNYNLSLNNSVTPDYSSGDTNNLTQQYLPDPTELSESFTQKQLDSTSLAHMQNSSISSNNFSTTNDNFEINFNNYNRTLRDFTDAAMASEEES